MFANIILKIDSFLLHLNKWKNIGIEIKNSISAEFIQLDVHKENQIWQVDKKSELYFIWTPWCW